MKKEKPLWLKIDNAGKIYPGTNSYRWNCVYRVSVVLKERVDTGILEEALPSVCERYPHYCVKLKKGVFWFYLHYIGPTGEISKESNYPCQRFDLREDKPLFRVLYSGSRISLEVFHSVADGFGSINFMNTLLLKYFHLQGKSSGHENILHYDDEAVDEEYEDSYLRYYDPSFGKFKRKETGAYHMTGDKEISGVMNVIHGEVDSQELLNLARSYSVTINELFIGMAAYVSYIIKLKDTRVKARKKPVKVQYAINLRRSMPSMTLRNFSGVGIATLKEIPDKEMSFEEVLASVTDSCRETSNYENQRRFINNNCAIEHNFFVKIMPLFIKSLIMKTAFYQVGEKINTLQITNLGVVKTPREFLDYVDRYEIIVGPQKYNKYSVSCITFNEKTVFTISSTLKTRRFERELFRLMAKLGLNVLVNNNKGE